MLLWPALARAAGRESSLVATLSWIGIAAAAARACASGAPALSRASYTSLTMTLMDSSSGCEEQNHSDQPSAGNGLTGAGLRRG